jgi:hypothetical protein
MMTLFQMIRVNTFFYKILGVGFYCLGLWILVGSPCQATDQSSVYRGVSQNHTASPSQNKNDASSANRGNNKYPGSNKNADTSAQADNSQMAGSSVQGSLRLGRDVQGFVYDALSPIRYEQLKLAWLNQHPGETPTPGDLENIAHAAFLTQHSERPLWKTITHWRMVGGPHPWYVVPRVQVENTDSEKAILNIRAIVRVVAEYGVWYPEKKGAITDVKRLQQNVTLFPIAEYTVPLEALAARDVAVKELRPISILSILKAHPDRFPNRLRVQVTLMDKTCVADTHTLALFLYTDVFSLPIFLY